MRQGVDFSWARPGGAAIRAAGFEFVVRYCPYPGDQGKGLTREEIADYRANGLAIAMVFESTAGRAASTNGYANGAEDAQQCEESVAALRFPSHLPIYFAVDFDAQPSQLPAIDDYLQGAASVLGLGRVGVYGSYRVVAHCHAAGTAAWFWQALAWSGGRLFPERHIYQSLNGQEINGGAVDYNEAADEFGQWKAEEDPMEPFRLSLLQIAGGEYSRMNTDYQTLMDAGLIWPDAMVDDLNGAVVRRFRLIELAASGNAEAAYRALGGV
jgi:hypothetical protein